MSKDRHMNGSNTSSSDYEVTQPKAKTEHRFVGNSSSSSSSFSSSALNSSSSNVMGQNEMMMGDFEDEFEDEWEEGVDEDEEGADAAGEDEAEATLMQVHEESNEDELTAERAQDIIKKDAEENNDDDDEMNAQAYLPGQELPEGYSAEELEVDNSAYVMLHSLQMEWPCLSFDILDKINNDPLKFPLSAYAVFGTQADQASNNKLLVVKMTQLRKTIRDDDEEDIIEDDEDDTEDDPILEYRSIKHDGGINRLRVAPEPNHIVAAWSEKGVVNIWNIEQKVRSLDTVVESSKGQTSDSPMFSFSGHPTEGFSLDWSTLTPGRLITGDCKKYIYLWNPLPSGTWSVDKIPYQAHSASVEDLQWSPSEANVFASCSVDQTLRIWDVRKKAGEALNIHAHTSDVNVLSWNKTVQYLVVTGGDDGVFKVWDLRTPKIPAAEFAWHRNSITSVEWHPTEDSVVAVAGADDQISIWDLSVEKDEDASKSGAVEPEVPPQLLFIHQGQSEIKELHWHKHHSGVLMSTSSTGFHVFKTISV